jgi:hypothetical protein
VKRDLSAKIDSTCKNWLVVKKILTSLVFRSNKISSHVHTSSHLLAVLAELKPIPNRTNLATQSKYIYIYDSRRNKNQKTSKTKLRL